MTFQWNVIWENLPRFLDGAMMTIWLSVATMAIAIPGGLVLAFMRLSRFRPVSFFAACFAEFFRATPLILQIYWVYYVLPAYFDIQLSVDGHCRARLQYLVVQFRNVPLRHRVDPPYLRIGNG